MRNVCLAFGMLMCGVPGAASASASGWQSRGEVALEARAFSDDHDPLTRDFGAGLYTRGELDWRAGHLKARVRAFARVDQQDQGRSIFVLEELWLRYHWQGIDVGLGFDIVNWSVHDVFHPADIVNARNFDSDFRRYEKTGEPMVSAKYGFGHGGVELFFMPRYSTPIAPSRASRLNFLPSDLEVGDPLFMEAGGAVGGGRWGLQAGMRLAQSIGGADLSIHVVRHMDRSQPEAVFDTRLGVPRPLFRLVTQVGGTYQHALGGFLIRLEGGYRFFASPPNGRSSFGLVQQRNHLIAAAGVEYGLNTDSDLTVAVFAEAQSIFLVDESVRRQLSFFQRDLAVGTRLSLGDVSATTLMVAGIVDLETPGQVVATAELSRRIGDSWSVNVGGTLVFGRPRGSQILGIALPADSDHVRLSLSRFF